MIKILRYPLCEIHSEEIDCEMPRLTYTVSESQGGLEVGIVDNFTNSSYTVLLNKSKNAGKIIKLDLSDGQDCREIKVYELYRFVSRTSGVINSILANGDCSIAKIAFEDNGDDVTVLLSQAHGEIVGCENIVMERVQTQTSYLKEHSAVAQAVLLSFGNKSKMINRIDHYNSLAYLEAQVDLLTRLVISMSPESALRSALLTADTYSVLNIKSVVAISREFEINKKLVRELQGEYYARKNHTD